MFNKNINIQKTTEYSNNFYNLDPILFDHNFQIKSINNIYFDNSFVHSKIFIKEIKKKINNYKSQDNKKFIDNSYNINFITFNDIIEKLIASKLSCYYCNNKIFIIYKYIRDDYQWTLDRLNNHDIHSNNNTIISCYKCNIQRRTKNSNKFKLSKDIINIKKI